MELSAWLHVQTRRNEDHVVHVHRLESTRVTCSMGPVQPPGPGATLVKL